MEKQDISGEIKMANAENYRRWEKFVKKTHVTVSRKLLALGVILGIAVAGVGGWFLLRAPKEKLKIIFKDQGTITLLKMHPTVKEIRLQRANGVWITLWSGEMTMALTPGGNEVVFAEVDLDAGTYVLDNAFISTILIEADLNGDGDAEDEDVDISGLGVENNPLGVENRADEKFTLTMNAWCSGALTQDFIYDGSGGALLFDLTFTPPTPENPNPPEISLTVTAIT